MRLVSFYEERVKLIPAVLLYSRYYFSLSTNSVSDSEIDSWSFKESENATLNLSELMNFALEIKSPFQKI